MMDGFRFFLRRGLATWYSSAFRSPVKMSSAPKPSKPSPTGGGQTRLNVIYTKDLSILHVFPDSSGTAASRKESLLEAVGQTKKVQPFLSRFKSPLSILELDHPTVTGDVYFGPEVCIKGTVIIVANPPARIDIPAGSVLEDKVVTGDLRILDH